MQLVVDPIVDPAVAPVLAGAAAARAAAIAARLGSLPAAALEAPSELAGWSRLTIACHLRYGALASAWMTADALAGRTTSFYPGGRAGQRPATLEPGPDETPAAAVADLAAADARLAAAWAGLGPAAWATPVREPPGNADLGPITVATLAMLRLTEVEVHGTDLGLDLDGWSEAFLDAGLRFRVAWTAARRRPGALVTGRWVLETTDGPAYRLSATPDGATAEETDGAAAGEAVVKGSRRDLLAMLLGRPPLDELKFEGDIALARRLHEAFPGP